jgi:acetoin utilization deacetylase AcuC-like enzyme
MKVTETGFGRLTSAAVDAANRWSEGRVLSFLEGGFQLEALAKSARIHVEELAETSIE